MKVCFKIIKTGSGNDVYFKELINFLNKNKVLVEVQYFNKYFQYFPFLLKIFNKKSTADLIHSNIEYGWVFKEKNVPLVVTVHHLVFEKEFQKNTSLFQKIYHYLIIWPNTFLTNRVADSIIAVSHYTKYSLEKYFGENKRISVIHNGIDLSIFKPLKIEKYNDGKVHLLFVGNLIKRKGSDLLPLIMQKLGSNYVLHYTSGLRTQPPKGFELNNMIPLGKLSLEDLVKEYNKCHALLFPTRLEGFGYCVAESLACNTPVVTSNNSSIPEVVNTKDCLCELNVDDFVKKIENIKINKKESSREFVQKYFDMNKTVLKYIDNYKKTLR